MAGQQASQENGKAPPATAPLAPRTAPDSLAALHPLALAAGRVVAIELAMAVEGLTGPAERAEELLEQQEVLSQFFKVPHETE